LTISRIIFSSTTKNGSLGISLVELPYTCNNVVGIGTIDGNMKCRMELNAVKLCPLKVVIMLLMTIYRHGNLLNNAMAKKWSLSYTRRSPVQVF